MKLTKVDGVNHCKGISENSLRGELKTEKVKKELKSCSKSMDTKEIIETRFNAQIEGRIYNEFIRKNGNEKSYNYELTNVTKEVKEDSDVASLFMLLYELYSEKKNDKWESKVLEIDINSIENLKKGNTKKYKIQYKLDLKKEQWLCRTEEEFKNKEKSLTFSDLLNDLKKEYESKNGVEIRKLATFKRLKEKFKLYKEKKISKTKKSINNNILNLEISENGIVASSKKEKYFQDLLKEILGDISEKKLENNLKLYYGKTDELLSDIENVFIEEIKDAKKRKKEKDIDYNCDNVKANILNLLRNYLKKELNESDIGKEIYKNEIKKYILTILSKRKKNAKKEEDKEKKIINNNLYFYLLKKMFFVDKEKNIIDKEKFRKKIEDNFINIFSGHILNHGKLIYYSQDGRALKNIKKIGTKELEYIKLNESLVRKISSLVSFGTYGIYNLLNHEDYQTNFEDVICSGEDFIKMINKESSFSLKINEKKLNYFFDSSLKNIEGEKLFKNKEEISNFVSEILESIYNVRNGVIHFKEIDFTVPDNKSNIVIEYFEGMKKMALERIIEKFDSNNLEYYFTQKDMENYFNKYKYSLVKNKVSFAPTFKRVVSKGENLYRADNNKNMDYKWFQSKERYGEAEKSYIRTKNFLLSELYYNNFFEDFLSDESLFYEGVEKAKTRKSKTKETNSIKEKSTGLAYKVIEKYEKSIEGNNKTKIEEYLYNLHKLEMDRISNEKNDKFEGQAVKETAKFINEYIEDIFLEGFINWLNKNYGEDGSLLLELNENKLKEKIEKAKEKTTTKIEEIIKIHLKPKLDKELSKLVGDKEILRLYLFLSMIDNKKLNEFSNEIVKFRQFYKKINKNENLVPKFLGVDVETYLCLCEFISLTRERLDTTKKEEKNSVLFERLYGTNQENGIKIYDELLEKFIDKDAIENSKRTKELYYQSDKATPILYSTLEETRKFSTQDFIVKSLESGKIPFKYSKKNDDEFFKLEEKIKETQKNKAEFHDNWKNRKKQTSENSDSKEAYDKFIKNMESVRKYNYLKNKQSLQNIYEFHKIIVELQSRNMAYINKYERDFKFLMLAIKENVKEENEELKKDIDDFLAVETNGKKQMFSVGNYETKIEKKHQDLDRNLIRKIFCPSIKNEESSDEERIRNYIAHFGHFTDSPYGDLRSKISFIEQMNLLIKLFSYDKKTKNHINKSMKIILEKYGMKIQFKRTKETEQADNPIYKIDGEIKSLKGRVLGKKNILEIHEEEFPKLIQTILEYKR
ncbi:MAG: type VI-A CRISPR-associated RNA-guided ribonuclease Cas13a [Fusobacteriaceae bacterium]